MGLQVSSLKNILVSQSSKEICLPARPFTKFPADMWTVGENNLLLDIHVYPAQLHRNLNDDGHWFWWADAEFCPFDESSVFATASVFLTRATRHWVPVPSMPNGRVLLYNLPTDSRTSCQIYSRTSCSVYPKIQPHPLGELVCYCGTGEVVVMGSDGDPMYQRSRDMTNAVHVYCAIAPNGVSFACLKRAMGAFILETYTLQTVMAPDSFVRCNTVCPGFTPSRSVSDSVQCKYSPDSKYICVSSSTGFLFTVSKYNLEKHRVICPDLTQKILSAAGAFDYDPRFPFQILTFGTDDRLIHTIDLETSELLRSEPVDRLIDCVRYSPDGTRLAIAFNNFDIDVLCSKDLSNIQRIQMSALCEEHVQRIHPNFQTVLNLSFSQTGRYLVSTSCDGHLRLWSVPKLSSLQEVCRDVILSCTPIRKVKNLEIPSRLKNFLMYNFF